METVTFALTPHTSAIIVQRRRYVDAILRPMETKKQLRSRVLAREKNAGMRVIFNVFKDIDREIYAKLLR